MSDYNSKTKPIQIGPSFRLETLGGLGLEFDALYQRLDYDVTSRISGINTVNQSFQQTVANRWQFPMLVQYSFLVHKSVVYVEVGPTISMLAGTKGTISTALTSPQVQTVSGFTWSPGAWPGYTGGVGMDIGFGWMQVRPEIRYTRWFVQPNSPSGYPVPAAAVTVPAPPQWAHIDQNEVSFGLGFSFGSPFE